MTSATRATDASAPPPREVGVRRPFRRLAVAALVGSAAVAGLSIVWLAAPELSPFTDPAAPSLASFVLDPAAATTLAFLTGVLGLALGAMLALDQNRTRRPVMVGLAASVIAVSLAFCFGSMSTIAVAGYLFGMLAVVAGLAAVAVALVRAPRLGLALLGGLLALLAASVWWAGLSLDGVVGFAVGVGGALIAGAAAFTVAGLGLVCTLVWAALAVLTLRTAGSGRSATWIVRHRRIITILAAAGPVPYAVARASWLTPWPLFSPAKEHLEPAVLATGLVIGAGGAAACLLTLGLILPWGRVFPSWLPMVGSRDVPIALAAVPGFLAAGILFIAAVPTLLTTVGSSDAPADALLVNLVLPFWYWGPMLALAVAAYVEWRVRGDEDSMPPVTPPSESQPRRE